MMLRRSVEKWDTLRDLKIGYVSLRRFAPPVDGLLATLALVADADCLTGLKLEIVESWLNPCFAKSLG